MKARNKTLSGERNQGGPAEVWRRHGDDERGKIGELILCVKSFFIPSYAFRVNGYHGHIVADAAGKDEIIVRPGAGGRLVEVRARRTQESRRTRRTRGVRGVRGRGPAARGIAAHTGPICAAGRKQP